MKLSRPVLDVIGWAIEKGVEDSRLPIPALHDGALARAEQLGLVVIAAPGRPASRLLAATAAGREAYSRHEARRSSPAARARRGLRAVLGTTAARELAGAVEEAARVGDEWAEATADALCALRWAFRMHGLDPLHSDQRPPVRVWAHAVGVAVFLADNDDSPGVVMSSPFWDGLQQKVAVYPWLLEHYTPAKLQRVTMQLPTCWSYYVASRGGNGVSGMFIGDTPFEDDRLLRSMLSDDWPETDDALVGPGQGWI